MLSLLPSGSSPAEVVIALVRNITSERQAAAELAEMRRRMLESAEQERLRLAQELHDGPMQDLYGAIVQMRLALYRIYQQCMANVLRHSNASRAVVAFHLDENRIVLDVWDNGRGFTVPEKWVELLRQGHYGLAGIAERVQALGGVL